MLNIFKALARRQLAREAEQLRPLVDQINRLLRALQLRLTRGRNALGNFAHALKTPLTRARQIASADGSERSRDVERALIHLEDVIETQLKRARVAGGDVPTAAIPLMEVLDDVGSVLKKVHADKALRLEIEVPAALVVRGDREDMLELFGNLLENAFKWARSIVRVSVTSDPSPVSSRTLTGASTGFGLATRNQVENTGSTAPSAR